MHEAEKTLTGSGEIPPTLQASEYYHALIELAYPRLAILSKAEQRAEAFLRVLDKWVDSK